MTTPPDKSQLINKTNALPDRSAPVKIAHYHAVTGNPMGYTPATMNIAIFAMGCFWGAERLFWQQPGIYNTAAGYSGGYTANPSYQEVCTGQTGHAECVHIVFDPLIISYQQLLKLFWENHDPAQGMRQGNDVGTQYRSAIYTLSTQQQRLAENSLQCYQQAMHQSGDLRIITTEIVPAKPFYYAEDNHQQYLYKNPTGYCGLGGIGICLASHPNNAK